jgi:general secretion pathway protein G
LKGGELPVDAWGNDYEYESPGTNNSDSYDIWSYGKDGAPGGQDLNADIGNWSERSIQ